MADFARRQPWRELALVIAAWVGLAGVNSALQHAGVRTGAPTWFPISVFGGPTFHLAGVPYVAGFLALLAYALRREAALSAGQAFALGLAFVCLGNLGQGGWDAAFLQPFYRLEVQYYHDALRVGDWRAWLADFNQRQPELLVHGRTHPPFAVLLHVALLRAPGGGLPLLAAALVAASCLSIPLVWHVLKVLGVPAHERGLLALLFALLPAVNVYAAVSLDGVVLTCATLWLLGLALVRAERPNSGLGVPLMAAGLVLTSLLTYAGVFLLGVGVLVGVHDLRRGRGGRVLGATALAAAVLAAVLLGLAAGFGYDHAAGFATASRLENPQGFRGFAEPVVYTMTRLEGAAEIALFLSLGGVAVLLARARRREPAPVPDDGATPIVLSAVATLALMLAAGAWRTGETARACLFIYPWLLLAFRALDRRRIADLCVLAGVQTAAMQLLGDYYW